MLLPPQVHVPQDVHPPQLPQVVPPQVLQDPIGKWGKNLHSMPIIFDMAIFLAQICWSSFAWSMR